LFWLLFVLVVILAQSPKVVILAQPESLYWPLPLLLLLFFGWSRGLQPPE